MYDNNVTGDLAAGAVIAGYRIQGVCGRGGMSVVYAAEDPRLPRTVALKVMSARLAGQPTFRERFLREARIAASLDHPHVIPVYDAGIDRGVLFMAMRHVDGTDLGALLRRTGCLPLLHATSIAVAVAEALSAAHRVGLVHRDVKPANVLLARGQGPEGEDHVYLADFGLARSSTATSGSGSAGELVGTISAMAPEQIRGEPTTPATDVYALGCLLFECLAGRPPFVRELDVAVLWAHLNDAPPTLASLGISVPPAVEDLVARCLAKTPAGRFESAAEVATALRLTGRPASGGAQPQPHRAARRLWRPSVSRRWATACTVAVVGALTGVLVNASGSGAGGERTPEAPGRLEDTVARIDPKTLAITGTAAVGRGPSNLAAGPDGRLWTACTGDHTVSVLDRGDHLIASGSAGYPTGLAVSRDAVWVAAGFAGEVVRIDPLTTRIDSRVKLAVGLGGLAADSEGGVWVTNPIPGTVDHIDPVTSSRDRSVPVGRDPRHVAVGGGSVWVTKGIDKAVLRLPRLGARPVTIGVRYSPEAVVVGAGAVWVTHPTADMVSRIDITTGAVTHSIPVGDGPSAIAYGLDAVWVAQVHDRSVARIDPFTGAVRTIPLGAAPHGIAVVEDAVRVSLAAP